jgi:predicted enzyme related to lactoylglutathione lyase
MHKSQLAGFIIDCKTDDLEAAADFWSQALGLGLRRSADPAEAKYIGLATAPGDPYIEVQRVDHTSRVHLDIETDNIEAEVARLEALGAKRVAAVRSWVVMEAPTGQRFCVVNAGGVNFAEEANRWE